MHEVRQRIAGRTLTPGAKLPSIRSFAQTCRYRSRQSSRLMTGWQPKASSCRDADRVFTSPDICRHCRWRKSGRGLTMLSTLSGCRARHWMQMQTRQSPVVVGCPPHGCQKQEFAVPCAPWQGRISASLTDYASPLGLKPLRQLLHAAWPDMALRRRPTRSC